MPPHTGDRNTEAHDKGQVQRSAYASPISGGEGGKGPLVSVGQVKGHLAILRAIARMKEEVMRGECGDGKDGDGGEKVKDAQKGWGWFVSMAVERYVPLRLLY